jgi:hypothetical protein
MVQWVSSPLARPADLHRHPSSARARYTRKYTELISGLPALAVFREVEHDFRKPEVASSILAVGSMYTKKYTKTQTRQTPAARRGPRPARAWLKRWRGEGREPAHPAVSTHGMESEARAPRPISGQAVERVARLSRVVPDISLADVDRREAIRRLAAQWAEATAVEQGLPATVEDEATLLEVATLLCAGRDQLHGTRHATRG